MDSKGSNQFVVSTERIQRWVRETPSPIGQDENEWRNQTHEISVELNEASGRSIPLDKFITGRIESTRLQIDACNEIMDILCVTPELSQKWSSTVGEMVRARILRMLSIQGRLLEYGDIRALRSLFEEGGGVVKYTYLKRADKKLYGICHKELYGDCTKEGIYAGKSLDKKVMNSDNRRMLDFAVADLLTRGYGGNVVAGAGDSVPAELRSSEAVQKVDRTSENTSEETSPENGTPLDEFGKQLNFIRKLFGDWEKSWGEKADSELAELEERIAKTEPIGKEEREKLAAEIAAFDAKIDALRMEFGVRDGENVLSDAVYRTVDEKRARLKELQSLASVEDLKNRVDELRAVSTGSGYVRAVLEDMFKRLEKSSKT